MRRHHHGASLRRSKCGQPCRAEVISLLQYARGARRPTARSCNQGFWQLPFSFSSPHTHLSSKLLVRLDLFLSLFRLWFECLWSPPPGRTGPSPYPCPAHPSKTEAQMCSYYTLIGAFEVLATGSFSNSDKAPFPLAPFPLLTILEWNPIYWSTSTAPTSFCKCTCFSNSTIIPLDAPRPEPRPSVSPRWVEFSNPADPPVNAAVQLQLQPQKQDNKVAKYQKREDRKEFRKGNCNDCNRQYCMDAHLPICKGAKVDDVFTTCFRMSEVYSNRSFFLKENVSFFDRFSLLKSLDGY